MALDAAPPPGGAHILVVDDDPLTREVLCRILARGGFAAVQAEDGLEARAQLRQRHFDLVLTDVYMPGEDGFGVLRAARDQDPDIAVVMCTAERDPGFDPLNLGARLGANAVLQKPIDPEQLLGTVRGCLAKRRVRAA